MAELVPIPSPGVPLEFGARGGPLVLVLHDWFGRLPWVESVARALADRGFRVLVPDLFGGGATTDDETAQTLLAALDIGGTLAALDDLVGDAREQGSTGVGLLGFSMGGWLALLHAQNGDADAVIAYYASLTATDHGVIPCTVQLHLAEHDSWGEGQQPEGFVTRLLEHGTPVSTFDYAGTRHGFANATLARDFDADAAALASTRTTSFLREHLLE
ncbi:MAG: hypothetical protein RI885_303 [Actinomycetota bacterium]